MSLFEGFCFRNILDTSILDFGAMNDALMPCWRNPALSISSPFLNLIFSTTSLTFRICTLYLLLELLVTL